MSVPVVTAFLFSTTMLPLSSSFAVGTGIPGPGNHLPEVSGLEENWQNPAWSIAQEQSLQRLTNRQIREQAERLSLEAESKEQAAKEQAAIRSTRWRAVTLSRPKTPSRGTKATKGDFNVEGLLDYALSLRGVSYLYGGTDPQTGLDCSAYTQLVFRKSGIELPRTAYLQFRVGTGIPRSSLEPGDLVFFSTNGAGASHVGIYFGDGKFLSATTKGVKVQDLSDKYWNKYYRGSRRIQQ